MCCRKRGIKNSRERIEVRQVFSASGMTLDAESTEWLGGQSEHRKQEKRNMVGLKVNMIEVGLQKMRRRGVRVEAPCL